MSTLPRFNPIMFDTCCVDLDPARGGEARDSQ